MKSILNTTFTVFVEVYAPCHHTKFNLSSCNGSFIILLSKWKLETFRANHLLTPGLYGPARNATTFPTEADYCYFTLCENVFFWEFLYFSNIYHQTTISNVTLNGIKIASSSQLYAPSILILIFCGKLRSTKAEVTSLVQNRCFPFFTKWERKTEKCAHQRRFRPTLKIFRQYIDKGQDQRNYMTRNL